MDSIQTINVATQFSKYPGGRFYTDGEFSGERFRDEILLPALQGSETVIVQLDGTLGYGSSFLEEAFGGLVRKYGFSVDQLSKQLSLETKNDTLKYTITSYMREAKPDKLGNVVRR